MGARISLILGKQRSPASVGVVTVADTASFAQKGRPKEEPPQPVIPHIVWALIKDSTTERLVPPVRELPAPQSANVATQNVYRPHLPLRPRVKSEPRVVWGPGWAEATDQALRCPAGQI